MIVTGSSWLPTFLHSSPGFSGLGLQSAVLSAPPSRVEATLQAPSIQANDPPELSGVHLKAAEEADVGSGDGHTTEKEHTTDTEGLRMQHPERPNNHAAAVDQQARDEHSEERAGPEAALNVGAVSSEVKRSASSVQQPPLPGVRNTNGITASSVVGPLCSGAGLSHQRISREGGEEAKKAEIGTADRLPPAGSEVAADAQALTSQNPVTDEDSGHTAQPEAVGPSEDRPDMSASGLADNVAKLIQDLPSQSRHQE